MDDELSVITNKATAVSQATAFLRRVLWVSFHATGGSSEREETGEGEDYESPSRTWPRGRWEKTHDDGQMLRDEW